MNRKLNMLYRFMQIVLLGLLLSRPVAAEEVTLNFSDADLVAVINSVSQITGKNFIIDPRVKGKVTVVSSKPLNEAEVFNVFLSILQVHGFATVPTENAIKIIPDATAKQNSTPLTNRRSTPEDQLITRVLKINFINAAQLVPILRPLVAQQGHLAAYSATNVLIVSDRASNIRRIERIIASMDRETDSDIEIIKLKHAFAAEVVLLLTSLNAASPEKKAVTAGVKFSADERTNSILLSGDKTSRLKYRAIISDLDSPVESSGNTHVIYLRYADAKNVAEILGNVGREAIKAEAKSAVNAKSASTPGSINIQADETSNALVISAPASIFPSLRSVIQQLDIARAQVHIEAIIAEVSLETSKELGVSWLIDGGVDEPVFSSLFGSELGDAVVASSTGTPFVPPPGATLGLGNIVDSGISFITMIRALATDNETNLLSTPSIVTLDNEEAEIVVGKNVPFVTGETSSTGTTGTVTNPFRTIERQDVGISLKVKPQINEGNTITLAIEQEVSTVDETAVAGAVDLTTSKRLIKTNVQLVDGELLVLGGLIEDRVIDVENKVPGLGDIPILGALFRATKKTKIKTNLLVFIKASIIKDPDKARQLSGRKYNFMRDKQLKKIEESEEDYPVLSPFE